MNLRDLANLNIEDLKKIDYKARLADIKKRPDILIVAGAVLATLVFFVHYIGRHQKALRATQSEIAQLEQKVKTIKDYDASQMELREFLENIPAPISEDALVNTILDFAQRRRLDVKSFSPARAESRPLYDLTTVDLEIISQDYRDIWLFVHDIENSPHALRIDSWRGSLAQDSPQRGRNRTDTADASAVKANIRVTMVTIKK